MVLKPKFGRRLSVKTLDSIDKYILITMPEPWSIIKKRISNKPSYLEFNYDMSLANLENLFNSFEPFITENYAIVGIGGGTACDTAKFLTWKFKEEFNFNLDLYLMPSIISVDAFLCSSIAVREDNKVKYVGESHPEEIIIDYNLIREAPPFLNRAGISDTISITSALGDWLIARDEINEKFDQDVFNQAKKIAVNLMDERDDIRDMSDKGIEALVNGFYEEVILCEEWGNARPEEGSEHFLAYCMESITHEHYIHGNLIGLSVLISLYLQKEYAEFSVDEIKQFYNDIQLQYTLESQKISYDDLKCALTQIKKYVIDEKLHYSIYNSPSLNLNHKKIEDIIKFIKSI
jgi:glycerol dehydrogenase-like iron-containing ADH family enzyme